MKIFYNYDLNKILTEEEATKSVKKEILDNDDYALWEFITDNYRYNEIMKNLSQDFLENIIKKIIENRLNNEELFLVREIPD